MKIAVLVSAAALSFSSMLFAETKVVKKASGTVSLYKLRCETDALSLQHLTLLNDLNGSPIISLSDENEQEVELQFEHTKLLTKGCNLRLLNRIAKRGLQNFNALLGAEVTITQTLSAGRLNGFGNCVADKVELVEVNIATAVSDKLILTSRESDLVPVNDCQ